MQFITGNLFKAFFSLIRLCSEYEECNVECTPVRLIDMYMFYEDHCKSSSTLQHSKDYLSKIIPRIFPSAVRKKIYRNNTTYPGFMGIRKRGNQPYACITSDEVAAIERNDTDVCIFCVPTVHTCNGKGVQFRAIITGNSKIEIEVISSKTVSVDVSLLDVPIMSTVTAPANAVLQIAKNITLCKGIDVAVCTGDEEVWGSIIETSSEKRARAMNCQAVVPWLSSTSICAKCRTLTKIDQIPEKESNYIEDGVECNDVENILLEKVFRTIREDDVPEGLQNLVQAQKKNIDKNKDPRHRRWSQEIIRLCLTLYCR